MADKYTANSLPLSGNQSAAQSCGCAFNEEALWGREKTISSRYGLGLPFLRRQRWEGGGPPFTKLANLVLYEFAAVEQWLRERTLRNTSESQDIAAVSQKRKQSRLRNQEAKQ